MVLHHPLGENRAAAADDSGDAIRSQRHVLNEHACMDRHVIDALLRLLFDHFEHQIGGEILNAPNAAEGFVNRDRADRDRRRVDDRLADARNVAAGGQIHDRVGAELH